MKRRILESRTVVKVLKNPASEEVKPARSRDDRVSLLSEERFVLKNSPENKPVKKINIKIIPVFFICMSPFRTL